jgi:hypothetical protein
MCRSPLLSSVTIPEFDGFDMVIPGDVVPWSIGWLVVL